MQQACDDFANHVSQSKRGVIMFEHKKLDGETYRVVPSTESFLAGDILEIRESIGSSKDPGTVNRVQYGVVGDRLVERCLPPESVGDRWSYDASDTPWWSAVNNPPHAGLVADFNSSLGGRQRVPLDQGHNVVAFGAAGEEVMLENGEYLLTRGTDGKEIRGRSLLETRQAYYAEG